jgi:hypothetical protein
MMQLYSLSAALRAVLAALRNGDEEGSVVEKVILTAIFAALAIAVGAIIVAKVTSTANSIPMN